MRKSIIVGIILVVLLACGIGCYNYSKYEKVKTYDALVYPGVSVDNVDLGGKTKVQAKDEIEKLVSNHLTNNVILIEAPERQLNLNINDLKVNYDVDKTVDKVFNYGKDLSNSEKLALIDSPQGINFDLDLTYDENSLNTFIDNVAKSIDRAPQNASIKVVSGRFEYKDHLVGYNVNKEALKTDILKELSNSSNKGLKVAAEEKFPQLTIDMLSSINAKISSYTTNYLNPPNLNRENNIKIAASKINGIVLMPEDVFSFNNIIGDTTEKEGYKKAPTISRNRIVDDYGGGICQVSSTLYSAMLHGNIKALERTNHNLPVFYIPLGLDATVSQGLVDYKFKNTLGHPMYIESVVKNGNITFNIYSNDILTQKSYKARNEIYATFEPKTIEEYDESLPKGTQKVAINPANGHKVRVYLDTIENGNVVNTELISDNHYYPIDKIVKIGV